jgi:hypothetical protein
VSVRTAMLRMGSWCIGSPRGVVGGGGQQRRTTIDPGSPPHHGCRSRVPGPAITEAGATRSAGGSWSSARDDRRHHLDRFAALAARFSFLVDAGAFLLSRWVCFSLTMDGSSDGEVRIIGRDQGISTAEIRRRPSGAIPYGLPCLAILDASSHAIRTSRTSAEEDHRPARGVHHVPTCNPVLADCRPRYAGNGAHAFRMACISTIRMPGP